MNLITEELAAILIAAIRDSNAAIDLQLANFPFQPSPKQIPRADALKAAKAKNLAALAACGAA